MQCAGKHRDLLKLRRQRPNDVDAFHGDELAQLMEADLGLAAGDHLAGWLALGHLDLGLERVGNAETLEQGPQMKAAGAAVQVAKNRLAQIALEGTDVASIGPLLKGPTLIAHSADPVAAAKAAVAFAKKQLGGDLKGKLSGLSYLAAIGLAFVNHWISVAIYIWVAILWFIPDRRIAKTMHGDGSHGHDP